MCCHFSHDEHMVSDTFMVRVNIDSFSEFVFILAHLVFIVTTLTCQFVSLCISSPQSLIVIALCSLAGLAESAA